MKCAFILTTFDRIDDLLAHLDILKFFPQPCEIIPIWMRKDVPQHFLEEMDKYPSAHYCDGICFSTGPLLGLVSGLRKAHELGAEYVIYRNGDDWLFNHKFVLDNIKIMDSGKDVAAYNWLTCDTFMEFAMNEMYLRVKKFIKTADAAEHYFKYSKTNLVCELKIVKWITNTLGQNLESNFYRLPGREFSPGVGYDVGSLHLMQSLNLMKMSAEFTKSLESNERFFNEKWQLIGSHNNAQRYLWYNKIRSHITYANELEKQPHFSRWVSHTTQGKDWNLPITDNPEQRREQIRIMKPMLQFRKLPKTIIHKMLPRYKKA